MQSVQTPIISGLCRNCDGLGVIIEPLEYYGCPMCDGSGFISQSGDLCRSSSQSSDVLGKEITNG